MIIWDSERSRFTMTPINQPRQLQVATWKRKKEAEVTKSTFPTGRVDQVPGKKKLNFKNSDLLLKLCIFWICTVVKQKGFTCVYLSPIQGFSQPPYSYLHLYHIMSFCICTLIYTQIHFCIFSPSCHLMPGSSEWDKYNGQKGIGRNCKAMLDDYNKLNKYKPHLLL